MKGKWKDRKERKDTRGYKRIRKGTWGKGAYGRGRGVGEVREGTVLVCK